MSPDDRAAPAMNEALFRIADRILAAAGDRGLPVRVLGGVAVAMRCPTAAIPPLARRYEDLDLITTNKRAYDVGELLGELGFAPEERFNRLHGRSRMLFESADGHLDVLVDRLVMCHVLELEDRIEANERTLPGADLLLSKLQIVQLNDKDVRDIVAILADLALTEDESGIHAGYVAKLVGADWGWWRTSTQTLETVAERLPSLGLPAESHQRVVGRINELRALAAGCRKSMRWRARARVGERVPWYNDPEEVA